MLMDPAPALEVRGLTKRYDDGTVALEGFSLTVPDGAFFGLLGPNGAGKTTLISSVCNLIRVTAGEVLVFGEPAGTLAARRSVGLAEQDVNLDRFLTVEETLVYHGGYFGMGRHDARRRAAEMIHVFDLAAKARVRTPKLSGGMRRRLHQQGTTILLTTHYREEAEALCEEIALIRGGRLIARDSAPGLREHYGAESLEDVYVKAMAG